MLDIFVFFYFLFFSVLNSCLFSTVVERENAYINYQNLVFLLILERKISKIYWKVQDQNIMEEGEEK